MKFEAFYALLEIAVNNNQILDDEIHEQLSEAALAYDEEQQELIFNLLDNC